MSVSTLFLNKISVIDHALIDQEGIIKGGSYNLSVKVSGEVKGEEQVVVDFSKLKSSIKQLIDSNERGYDHKLWFIREYSKGEVSISEEGVSIETPSCRMNIPENAIKIFYTEYSCGSLIQTIEVELEFYLNYYLNVLYPNINIKVGVELDEEFYTPKSTNKIIELMEFRYIHGLRNSSSWGCQNIGHGHLSFLGTEYDANESTANFNWDILHELEDVFREKNNVFIFDENLYAAEFDVNRISTFNEYTSIFYETERGEFFASYKNSCYNIIIMNKETTIENILTWFVEENKEKISTLGIQGIYISEGLQKGSFKTISTNKV